jgi:hypothetical protein
MPPGAVLPVSSVAFRVAWVVLSCLCPIASWDHLSFARGKTAHAHKKTHAYPGASVLILSPNRQLFKGKYWRGVCEDTWVAVHMGVHLWLNREGFHYPQAANGQIAAVFALRGLLRATILPALSVKMRSIP